MIIFRYLNREISLTLAATTSVLLFIFLSNEFARLLSQAATGKFAQSLLLKLMAIEIPHLLIILLPLGLFLAVILAYGRLYVDNEITVLSACGFSQNKLVKATLPTVLSIALIVCVLSIWAVPKLLVQRNHLLAQSGTAIELQAALPGRFQGIEGGKRVFYVENISADKQHMLNIFMAQLPRKIDHNSEIPPWVIVTANTAYQMIDNTTGDRFLVTVDGRRYEGSPGSKNFRLVNYKEYGIRIESHTGVINNPEETLSTLALFQIQKNKNAAKAELGWRFSLPLSTLILGLIAIPLSRVKPRHGRYSQLFPAILIYTLYINLLLVNRNWIGSGMIHPLLGLTLSHGIMLFIMFLLWLQQIGWQHFKNSLVVYLRRLR